MARTGSRPYRLPAHLQVAGPALVVRRVEHEGHALVADGGDGVLGQGAEDALATMVGVGGGVDRAHRRHHLAVDHQLPPQERPKADDVAVDGGDPARRPPERVLLVLPREELTVAFVGAPAERRAEQLEHGRRRPKDPSGGSRRRSACSSPGEHPRPGDEVDSDAGRRVPPDPTGGHGPGGEGGSADGAPGSRARRARSRRSPRTRPARRPSSPTASRANPAWPAASRGGGRPGTAWPRRRPRPARRGAAPRRPTVGRDIGRAGAGPAPDRPPALRSAPRSIGRARAGGRRAGRGVRCAATAAPRPRWCPDPRRRRGTTAPRRVRHG